MSAAASSKATASSSSANTESRPEAYNPEAYNPNIEQFLSRVFAPSDVAKWQAEQAAIDDISKRVAFQVFLVPFAEGRLSANQVKTCTYRYVIQHLDTQDPLDERGWRMINCDWFSSREQAELMKSKLVCARQYAQALVQHKNIVKAEKEVLAPQNK